MSSLTADKPPSLPMPNPGSSGSPSLLNGGAGAGGSAPILPGVPTKVKTPTQSSAPAPLQTSHVLPHPSISSAQSYQSHPSTYSPHTYQPESQYSQQPYVDMGYQDHHMSQPQQHTPVAATAPYAPNGHVLQPSYTGHPSHPPYYRFNNGVSSPNQPNGPGPLSGSMQLLPLPANQLTPAPSPLSAVPPHSSPGGHKNSYRDSDRPFDTTGQRPPPGAKPQVTAMLWEDEGSLCFQVEANGVCVARREDNHMINGTKLLNVAGMTRGRRDGILKSEKQRHVVKIGPMHLKGVWIPFERALDFANKEKITELLYPLFVNNISALMYHPMNTVRTNAILQAVERKRLEQSPHFQAHLRAQQGRNPSDLVLPSSQPPSLPMTYGVGPLAISQPPSNALVPSRPEMGRSLTFPTTTTSTEQSYWNSGSAQPLSIDVNSRSLPNTPVSTPPANSLMQYPPNGYDRNPLYGSSTPQQNMSSMRFGGPLPSPQQAQYGSQPLSMAPPPTSRVGPGSRPSSRQANGEVKDEEQPSIPDAHSYEVVNEQRKDDGYAPPQANGYDSTRNNYYAEHASQPNGQGGDAPTRTAYDGTSRIEEVNGTSSPNADGTQQWSSGGYTTSPHGASAQSIPRNPPQREIFDMMNGQNGQRTPYEEPYSAGLSGSKRIRELDDDEDDDGRPTSSDGRNGEEGGMKRRKTISQGSGPTNAPPANLNRSFSQKVAGRATARR